MKIINVFIWLLIFNIGILQSQNQTYKKYCQYSKRGKTNNSEYICKNDFQSYSFSSENIAKAYCDSICMSYSSPNRFSVIQCDLIENAAAVISGDGKTMLIGYNPIFMKRLITKKGNYTAISMLAHEIGHHISGHSLNLNVSDEEKRKSELEADEFSGFIMARLGYTLDQAQSAIVEVETSDEDQITHPGKSKRLYAIEKGYKNVVSNYYRYSNVSEFPKLELENSEKEWYKADSLIAINKLKDGIFLYHQVLNQQKDKRVKSILTGHLAAYYQENTYFHVTVNGGDSLIQIGQSDVKSKNLALDALALWENNYDAIELLAELEESSIWNRLIDNERDSGIEVKQKYSDYQKCLELYKKAINVSQIIHEESSSMTQSICEIFFDLELYDSVIFYSSKAFDRDPSLYNMKTIIGKGYLYLGAYEKAQENFYDAYYYAKLDLKRADEDKIYYYVWLGEYYEYLTVCNILTKKYETARLFLNSYLEDYLETESKLRDGRVIEKDEYKIATIKNGIRQLSQEDFNLSDVLVKDFNWNDHKALVSAISLYFLSGYLH